MASKDPYVEIPFGTVGMIARANRLRAEPTELLDGQGITMEDVFLRKEAGAVKLDAAGITGAPNIIALYDWNPTSTAAGTGTVTTVVGSQTVVGVGTLFLTEVNVGDYIRVGSETQRVIAVASNLSLTTFAVWKSAAAASAYTVIRQQRLISATDNGNIYIEVNGNLDAFNPVTGLIPSLTPGRFVPFGKESASLPRKLAYFTGRNAVQVIEAATFTGAALALPPTDWTGTNQPVNGTVHENRLVAWGNENDPHRIYISDPDNQEAFTTAAGTNMRVASDLGDRIWCGISFNGILWMWKYPIGICYLCDNSPSPGDWCIRVKSTAVGCAPSPYAALPMDDDVLFMAADGSFHLLSAVQEMGGTRSSDLSYALGLSQWLRDNVNLSRLDLISSAWYQHKKLALFTVPGTGSLTNSLTLKFDFGDTAAGGPVKFSYSRRDLAGAIATRRQVDTVPTPITGEGPFVYLLEQEARSKDGAGYTSTFQTPHLDLAWVDPKLRNVRKRFEWLEFVFEPVAAGTLTAQVYVDQVLKQTLSYNATKRRQRLKLNVGDGYTISIKGTNSVLNEDYKALAALIWYGVGVEDQSRPV